MESNLPPQVLPVVAADDQEVIGKDERIVAALDAADQAVSAAVAETADKLSSGNKTLSQKIQSLRFPDQPSRQVAQVLFT